MHCARFDRTALALFSLVVLYGCASLIDPEEPWQRRVGVIEIGGMQPAPIQMPEIVTRGVPFAATVVTYGSGSCTRADGAEVRVSGLTAEVTPYDKWLIPGDRGQITSLCTGDLRAYPREVTFRFDEGGEALIRVRGRTVLGELGQYEARVVVQP